MKIDLKTQNPVFLEIKMLPIKELSFADHQHLTTNISLVRGRRRWKCPIAVAGPEKGMWNCTQDFPDSPITFALHINRTTLTTKEKERPMTQTKSLDIKHEIKILKKATKKITASRKAARKFLVEHGYHTKDGKLTEKYS